MKKESSLVLASPSIVYNLTMAYQYVTMGIKEQLEKERWQTKNLIYEYQWDWDKCHDYQTDLHFAC